MQVELKSVSKVFVRNRVLSEVNYTFTSGSKNAILGANGSGKSTLLGVVSGLILPTSGEVVYSSESETISSDLIYQHLTLSAPYLSLTEDFTLLEIIDFHFKLKESYVKLTNVEFAEKCLFNKNQFGILYKHFSSGMKQRLKLGLAILTKGDILLLDEPFTNLDVQGKEWCKNLINENLNNRTLLIASNDEEEYEICKDFLNL